MATAAAAVPLLAEPAQSLDPPLIAEIAPMVSARDEFEKAKRRAQEFEFQLEKLTKDNAALEESNRKLQEEMSYLSGLSMDML